MHKEWEFEAARIKEVRELIGKELVDRLKKSDELKADTRKLNKEMWDETGGISSLDDLELTTYMQYINLLKQNLSDMSDNKKRILMLEKQYNSPYFCRIDFKEDGYESESFYIGIYGLRKPNKIETLIYDWRAPVSNLFYDYEPGRASYTAPSGTIEGELLLKRQFRIENGQLKLMFDCNIAIEDDILQDILAQNTGNGMKTIVSTIQKEQNRAIRYDGKRIFVVSGPAGSGKTSIATHRAAYLLYRHRDNLKAENIALFAPCEAFADYISNVLPELGEENIQYKTMGKLVKNFLADNFIKYESYDEYMERLLLGKGSKDTNKRLEMVRFKASKEFIEIIEQYVRHLEGNYDVFEDIASGNQIFADKKELERLFHESMPGMTVAQRLAQINFMLRYRINEYEPQRQKELEAELTSNSDPDLSEREIKALSRLKVTKELEPCRKAADAIGSINIVKLYRELFSQYISQSIDAKNLPEELVKYTVDALDDGLLLYEDQAPMLYLMSLLGMIEADRNIRHVIIDEAQDYSEITFKFLFRLYPYSSIAILGDPRQNINSYGSIGELRGLKNILNDDLDYLELSKSYRSTKEIMQFAQKILPQSEIEAFGRQGRQPEILLAESFEKISDAIVAHLKSLENEDYNRIAVICRTLKDCKLLYDRISKQTDAVLFDNGTKEIPSGIIIIPSYLTKGLEFDAVAAVIGSADDYSNNEDTLLYTVCTRALHRLDLFSVKDALVLERLTTDAGN